MSKTFTIGEGEGASTLLVTKDADAGVVRVQFVEGSVAPAPIPAGFRIVAYPTRMPANASNELLLCVMNGDLREMPVDGVFTLKPTCSYECRLGAEAIFAIAVIATHWVVQDRGGERHSL